MSLIEANIKQYLCLFCCHIYCLSSLVKDFSYSVSIYAWINFDEFFHETFTKICEVLAAQKWEFDSASKLQEHSGFIASW